MIGKCFFVLCLISLTSSVFCETTSELSAAIIGGVSEAISLIFSLVGMMCFWCGILEVIKRSGGIKFLSIFLSPFLRLAFPKSWKSDARDEIASAVSANILGLGNAATPLALCSMEMLDRQNANPSRASDDMIMFAVLGSAPFSLVPTTVITLLSAGGCKNPFAVIVPVWIASALSCFFALILCRTCAAVGSIRQNG